MNNLLSELVRNGIVTANKAMCVYKIKDRINIIEKQLDRLYSLENAFLANKIANLEEQKHILEKGI